MNLWPIFRVGPVTDGFRASARFLTLLHAGVRTRTRRRSLQSRTHIVGFLIGLGEISGPRDPKAPLHHILSEPYHYKWRLALLTDGSALA